MAIVVHTIDTNADTVIVLRNPLVKFAIWNPPGDVPVEGMLPPEDSPTEEPISTKDYDEEAAAAEESAEQAVAEKPIAEEPVVEPAIPEDFSYEEIHYHVSMNHLRLGSLYYKRMFSGNWRESIPSDEDGRYHTTLQNQDPKALLICLNALHLRNRQVPRSVSLETLAKIALLVDYFDSAEALELSIERWVDHVKRVTPVPSGLCQHLLMWMFIAWVFKLPEEFAKTTAVAIKCSKQEDLSISDLPIRSIVESIDRARNQAISTVISSLSDLLSEYRNVDYKCPQQSYSFECGSILYGALIKELDSLGLLTPDTTTPVYKESLHEIYSKLCNIKSPRWCKPNQGRYPSVHACSINERATAIADGIITAINGLELTGF